LNGSYLSFDDLPWGLKEEKHSPLNYHQLLEWYPNWSPDKGLPQDWFVV